MQKKQVCLGRLIGCVLLALAILVPGVCFAKPIVLKGITVFEPTRNNVIQLTWLANKVKEKSGGDLQINIIGGPDIIPIPEQPQSLIDGAVDIMLTFQSTFEDKVPQTIAMAASVKTPQEERDNGFFDWMNTKTEKVNMRYIARSETNSGYFIFGNKKVANIADLKGQKIGVSPMYIAFTKKLGAVPILIDEPNMYTALSRNTVDAHISPPEAQLALGLYEVSKYIIGPIFYPNANMMILVNLDTWKKMTPEQQKIMLECGVEVEKEAAVWFGDWRNSYLNDLTNKYKMEVIEFSPEETKAYLDLANEAQWDKTKEKNTPEDYEALIKFLK